jgi:hypothetical protein
MRGGLYLQGIGSRDRNRNKRITLSARNGQQDGIRNERRTLSVRNWQQG